jgi:hypothetical protein
MPILITSVGLINEAVIALQRAIAKATSRKYPHNRAQETFALILEFRSFYELRHPGPSLPQAVLDHHLSDGELSSRRKRQAQILAERDGLDIPTARQIIDEVAPSGLRIPVRSFLQAALMGELAQILCRHLRNGSSRTTTPDEIVTDHVLTVLRLGLDADFSFRYEEPINDFLSRLLPHFVESYKRTRSGDIPFHRRIDDEMGWVTIRNLFSKQFRELFKDSLSYRDRIPEEIRRQLSDVTKVPSSGWADALHGAGVFDEMAKTLVETLVLGVGKRPVLDAVIERRNAAGFYKWFPGIEKAYTDEADYWRPLEYKETDVRTGSTESDGVEISVRLVRDRVGEYGEPTPQIAFYFVVAEAKESGRTVGLVRGELLVNRKPNQRVSKGRLYAQAEEKSSDLARFIHLLLKKHDGDASEIFAWGHLFYLTHWEVVPEKQGTDFATLMLWRVVADLRRRHPGLRSVAYEPHPVQFPHPFPDKAPPPLRKHYDEARDKLRAKLNDALAPAFYEGDRTELEITEEEDSITNGERYLTDVFGMK